MSTESANEDQFTTVCIRRSAKERLEEVRPYESLSWTEFAEELADVYEASNKRCR